MPTAHATILVHDRARHVRQVLDAVAQLHADVCQAILVPRRTRAVVRPEMRAQRVRGGVPDESDAEHCVHHAR